MTSIKSLPQLIKHLTICALANRSKLVSQLSLGLSLCFIAAGNRTYALEKQATESGAVPLNLKVISPSNLCANPFPASKQLERRKKLQVYSPAPSKFVYKNSRCQLLAEVNGTFVVLK